MFDNYEHQKQSEYTMGKLQRLELLNSELNSVFSSAFQSINYDQSVKISKEMEGIFLDLYKNDIDINKSFEVFNDKIWQLERFKSANSIALNSKIYLFELAGNNSKSENNQKTVTNSIINALSIIGTQDILQKDTLKLLEKYIKDIQNTNDDILAIFLQHYQMIIKQVAVMQENSKYYQNDVLSTLLKESLKENQDHISVTSQNKFYSSIFVFAFTVLLLAGFIFITVKRVLIPIKQLEELSSNLVSNEANLRSRLNISLKSELAKSASYINSFIALVQKSILQAIDNAEQGYKSSELLQKTHKI